MRRKWGWVVGLMMIGLIKPGAVYAQVVINEIYPFPPSDRPNDEWVELYNTNSETISLAGYQLEDIEGATKSYTIKDKSISGNGYFVLEKSETKIALNNGVDGIKLFNPTGDLIDQTTYGKDLTNDMSWGRVVGGWQVMNQTKGTPNIEIGPTTIPVMNQPKVSIVEINACPQTGGEEWVKIKNEESEAVKLEGWKIQDAATNTQAVNIDLSAGGMGVISWKNSFLNNSGDTVKLVDNNGTVVEEITYEYCANTKSQAKATVAPTVKVIPTPTIIRVENTPTSKPIIIEKAKAATMSGMRVATVAGIINLATKAAKLDEIKPANQPTKTKGWGWVVAGGLLCTATLGWPLIRPLWSNLCE